MLLAEPVDFLNKRLTKLSQDIYQMQQQGDFKKSKPLCDALFDYGIDEPDFLNMYALSYWGSGSYEKAKNILIQLVDAYPGEPRYMNSLVLVLLDMDHSEEIIQLLDIATSRFPSYYFFRIHLGDALSKEARIGEAILEWLIVTKADDISADLACNALEKIATAYFEMHEYDKCAEIVLAALAWNPTNRFNFAYLQVQCALKKNNFALVDQYLAALEQQNTTSPTEAFGIDWTKAQRFEQTGNIAKAAHILRPWINFIKTHGDDSYWQNNLAVLFIFFSRHGRIKEADQCYGYLKKELIKSSEYRYMLSFIEFEKGDWQEAFRNYENRFKSVNTYGAIRRFSMEQWAGQELSGKKLLIWAEQGIGDVVAFSSVVPELKNQAMDVTIEIIDVQKKLIPLLQLCFPWITFKTFEHDAVDCRSLPQYAHYDYHIPLGSLVPIFRKTLDDFQQKQKPFIPRQKNIEQQIRKDLGVQDHEKLIGLCWRSCLRDSTRNTFYLDVEDFVPLKNLKDVKFVSVQYDECSEEIKRAQALGLPLMQYDKIDQKDDLVGACGLLGACDFVISVCTAVVPLADGLGVPTICIGKKNAWTCFGTNYLPMHASTKYFGEKTGHMARAVPKIVKWIQRSYHTPHLDS